ncbi:MAG: hypothetical protein HY654_13840, partial [Acidobacteria bacterium]|nr:hypothetical protein [Acidobacteriota bacterium]
MTIVRFNQWEEFIEELKSSAPDDRVVRLTFSTRYDARGTAHLTMVAGFLHRETIVECVHPLGVQPQDPSSDRAKTLRGLLEERKRYLEGQGYLVKP